MSLEAFKGSQLELKWSKLKIKRKARQRKLLKDKEKKKSVFEHETNSSENTIAQFVPVPNDQVNAEDDEIINGDANHDELAPSDKVNDEDDKMVQCDPNHDEVAPQVVDYSEYIYPETTDNNDGEVHPDYDLPPDLNDPVYDSKTNENNNVVNPYSVDTSANIDDVEVDMSDVIKNSVFTVDCEVDDILRLLSENDNDDNCSVMSVEIIPNTTSDSEYDTDVMLTELESNQHNPNEVSAIVSSKVTSSDAKSARSVADLNRINLVNSQLTAAQNCSTYQLLQSDVSYINKSQLVNCVQSFVAAFHVSPETDVCS